MRLMYRSALAAAFTVAAAGSAAAGETYGPYIGGYGAYVIPDSVDFEGDFDGGGRDSFTVELDNGFGFGGLFGYDYGNWRFEADIGYRLTDQSRGTDTVIDGVSVPGGVALSGDADVLTVLVNVLYEFENNSAFTPYLGAGAGAGWLFTGDLAVDGVVANRGDQNTGFAYQGIAGAKYEIDNALSAFVDYRYVAVANVTYGRASVDLASHNINAGLIYAFSAYDPPPPPVPQPGAAEVAPAASARSFMVFFDWNSAAITPEATAIIQDAAQSSMTLGVSRIELTGHADRSGATGYNQALSLRRAQAVKAQLVSLGLDPAEIVTVGKGESAPLVPTPDGVREPQNRRVEIVLP